MFVKILILIITITLIANEFYNFLDKLNSKIRKILLFSIIAFLTLLSLIDIYNDEQDAIKLKEKTDAIFNKAKQINELQSENNSNIVESKEEIVRIGSSLNVVSDTLSSQVVLLNKAVKKSKEIVELEKSKIRLGKPKMQIYTLGSKFLNFEKDTSLIHVDAQIKNIGDRVAKGFNYEVILIVFNENSKRIKAHKPYFRETGITDVSKSSLYWARKKFNIDKKTFKENYGRGILIYLIKYLDPIDSMKYEENLFLSINSNHLDEIDFFLSSKVEQEFALSYLKSLNLDDYISN